MMQIGEPTNSAQSNQATWIAVALVDKEGRPQSGEEFCLETPAGEIITGRLNQKGVCRMGGLEKGTYRVSFPNIQDLGWSLIS